MAEINTQNCSTISCEIQITRARNIEKSSLGKNSLFVRCYLPAGNNQRVQLNSQEISASKSDSNLFWNESFSLDCMGTQDSINMLKQATVVFELRSRKYLPVFGKNISSGSQVLGRAEIQWKRVFESTEMEIEEWAIFIATTCKNNNKRVHTEDVKPPAVKIAMKVKAKEALFKISNKNERLRRCWDESCACKGYCGCNGCSIFSADDYEIFALGAAI